MSASAAGTAPAPLPSEFTELRVSRISVGEISLRVRDGGSGPPLLLLHGYPETHLAWGLIAGELAKEFTVVAPDLRGYGDSSKPASVPGHESYGKRAMAEDCVALMAQLGFDRFDVVGHDRGGRVAYRMALDSPEVVRRLTVMDVVPTGEVWARADARFALAYWHWGFLAQPHPVPERLIAHDPEFFLFDAEFGGAIRRFPPEAVADYARCARDPAVIEAMCEDYRAGATCDRQWDDEDRAAGRRISCPTQVLWAGKGALAAWYDTLAIWRDWAEDVTGQALDCGHFLTEECPGETLAAIRDFHVGRRAASGSAVPS
jgi:haloacetate dehalogenase